MTKPTWFSAALSAGDPATADIAIYDDIGYWGVSAQDFRAALAALGDVKQINLRINSGGGEVFDGIAVANMLARHPARIVTTIDGIAASIASLIAVTGDEVQMPENAMMMIHNPAGGVMGTAADMRDWADVLDKTGAAMVTSYVRKTGMPAEKMAALLDAETWLTAQEAKDLGFADTILPARRMQAALNRDRYPNAPPAALALVAKRTRAVRGDASEGPLPPYDPDGDGDNDAQEALTLIQAAIDLLGDAADSLTGVDADADGDPAEPAMPVLPQAGRRRAKRARAAATAPEWVVGAAEDLPVDDTRAWDGAAATERMLAAAGFDGNSPDPAMAKRGFLAWDHHNPNLKGSYKLPFADMVGGVLTALRNGIDAAAARLPDSDLPQEVKDRARQVIDAYEAKPRPASSGAAQQSGNDAATQAAALRERDIRAACQIAGVGDAVADLFVASDKPLDAVTAALAELRVTPAGREINARHNGLAQAASWDKIIERENAKVA